jgi:hypothetical protein
VRARGMSWVPGEGKVGFLLLLNRKQLSE